MINKSNLKTILPLMNFKETSKNIYSKTFSHFEGELCIDFNTEKLIYPEEIKGRERNDGFDAPENFVVFECVNKLLDKGYRPEHIELEKEWHLGHAAKGGRADICVTSPEGDMLFIVECKTYGKGFDKAYRDTNSDGAQLFSYWQQENSTKWLVLYASDIVDNKIIWKAPTINCQDDPNVIISAKKDKSVKLYETAHNDKEKYSVWKETYSSKWYDDLIFSADSVAYKIGLKPLLKKDLKEFTPDDKIVNRFEEILRHNNVSDKENAFNRLVALFICKLVDEINKNDDDEVEFQYKQGTDTYETLQDRLQRLHKEGMETFMHEEIFYVPENYPEWLFTTYTGQKRKKAIADLKEKIRILKFFSNNDFAFKDVHNEELFYQNGKILVEVVQLFEKYRIVYPSKHQFLGDLFEQLLNKGFKQNEGQFFTPTPITRFIWDSLPIEKLTHSSKGTVYPKIIDYACGAGHFLTEAVEAINAFVKTDGTNAWVRDHIFGVEKDYRLARVSKISLYMNGAGEGNIIFGDGLENLPERQIENGSFDILVANPPYAVKDFKQHLQLKNNEFSLLNSIGDNGSEIETLFVERIEQLLKPQGIAAVVLPSSILSNDSASYIGAREHILKNFYIRAIVQFGSKTFGATGTNTVVLFLEKYNEPPKQTDLICDSIDAILSGEEIKDWKDKEILEAYINKIEVDKDIYEAFIMQTLSFAELQSNEYFNMYVEAFLNDSATVKYMNTKVYQNLSVDEQSKELLNRFYNYSKSDENDKLTYFALTYNQQTVIITSPADNTKQKEFLGYDWSNRKGNEGIQIITPGGKMYNDDDRCAENTLAHIVKSSFEEKTPDITEENKLYAGVVKTADMLDFSRLNFNKAIRTGVDKQIHIVSKYPLVTISSYVETIGGLWTGKKPPYTKAYVIRNTNFTMTGKMNLEDVAEIDVEVNQLNNRSLISGDIIIEKSGGSETQAVGRVVYFDIDNDKNTKYSFSNFCARIRITDDKLLSKYLFLILNNLYQQGKTFGYQNGMGGLKNLELDRYLSSKIPLPPVEIQEQIIKECDELDKQYEITRMSIEEYRKKIENIFDELEVIAQNGEKNSIKLSSIASFNPSKSLIQGISDDIMVSFVEMASVSNDGYIQRMTSRPLGEVKKGSYTYFAEDDIIIAKITPCMENGKCAVAKGLTNGIAFGSSEFHVVRCNENYLPDYVFGFLNRSKVRVEAEKNMTGTSGHRRVPVSYYQNIDIPITPLTKQKEIIDKVEKWQSEIYDLQSRLSELSIMKNKVLEKYL